MREIRKQFRAQRDLLDIWLYSYREWGIEQADTYVDAIDDSVAMLATRPLAGRLCEEVGDGLRRIAVSRHRVFYLVSDEAIDIVRILHERMDLRGQFAVNGD